MNMDEISKLELDLLMVFFTFSDQWGNVDMLKVSEFTQQKMNLVIQNKPFTLTQEHMEVLIKNQMVPDISPVLQPIIDKAKKVKLRKKRIKKN